MNMIETVVQLWASVDGVPVFGNVVVNQPVIVDDGAGVCVDGRHERTAACKDVRCAGDVTVELLRRI